MGTVRGNMGTALKHIVLSTVVDWACSQPGHGPLRYVDTHAMAPLNRPVGRDFNLLERLRGSNRTTGTPGASLYAEVFSQAWLPDATEWYPTHFVHAARVANRRGSAVAALLFEMNDADAVSRGHPPENRRAEIDAFLNAPLTTVPYTRLPGPARTVTPFQTGHAVYEVRLSGMPSPALAVRTPTAPSVDGSQYTPDRGGVSLHEATLMFGAYPDRLVARCSRREQCR
jgi:hypothetical protein